MNATVKSSEPIEAAAGTSAGPVAKLAEFKSSLSGTAPEPRFEAPLAALWWAAKGQWDRAHRLIQDESSTDAAWVHAYLHRVEGDLGNAGYWYRRAARPVAVGSLDGEWEQIVAMLLGGGSA